MDKYHKIAKCMDLWMDLREKDYSINNFFLSRNVQKVGIYGYGILGRHLIWELEQSNIDIMCILDRRAESIKNAHYPLYLPEDIGNIDQPDLIVVCAVNDFDVIEASLCEKTHVSLISMDTILKECYKKMQMEQST